MKLCLQCKCDFESNGWLCPACGFEPVNHNNLVLFSEELSEANNGFNKEHFKNLVDIEENNFWFCVRNKLILWALKTHFPHASNFFEIGCGTGFVLRDIERHCSHLALFGSEIFTEGLEYAKMRTNASLIQMDAKHIPFVNEFDVIGMFDVLEHIDDDEFVLSQMYNATSKNGGIIITVPQHRFLWSKVDELSSHKRRYVIGELQTKLQKAGFKVITSTSFVTFLLPFIVLSRMRLRFLNSKFNLYSEFKINTVLNIVFKAILNFEMILVKIGIRFPFGSSLLVIAKK